MGEVESGLMTYYKFVVSRNVKVIEISVNPLTDGDPDLYVKY